MEARKAIFLDKDGTVIPDIPFNVNPDLITLNNGVLEGLSLLKKLGYVFIFITNQSGIAKGLFKEQALIAVKNKIQQLLSIKDILVSGFYYCPHAEDGVVPQFSFKCTCRKPAPNLILQAAAEHQIDLSKSWMIGDILNDVEAGKSAGCKSLLINNGNETEWLVNGNLNRIPDWISNNFLEAAKYIANHFISKDRPEISFEHSH